MASSEKIHSDFEKAVHKLTWDPKTIEIRTKSVERTLEPLVRQVTLLVNHTTNRHRKEKRPSKKATELAEQLENATSQLVKVGQSIADDYSEIKLPMLEACREAENSGLTMKSTSMDFILDSFNSTKRNSMIRSSRALLSSVTHLLCIADKADVHRLLSALQGVEDRLHELKQVKMHDELSKWFKLYGESLIEVAKLSGLRQNDLKDLRRKEEIAAARATLKKSSKLLFTTSKVYITHRESDSALRNRDFVVHQISNALATLADVIQAVGKSSRHPYEEEGYLANALRELLSQLELDSQEFLNMTIQSNLTTLVDDIVNGASSLAEVVCTKKTSKDKVLAECHNVKDALTNLYECGIPQFSENPDKMEELLDELEHNVKILARLLRKVVVGHVSESFLEIKAELSKLMRTAASGNISEVEYAGEMFVKFASELEEVSTLACTMSSNAEGIKLAKIAAKQLNTLSPQVSNAAHTLAKYPSNSSVRDNVKAFSTAWSEQADILTEAVDDIIAIDDFLIVAESRILDDINNCADALQNENPNKINLTATSVRTRMKRVEHIVRTEMESSEDNSFTETIMKSLEIMTKNILPTFLEQIDLIINALTQIPFGYIDKNSFVDAARLVYEGMKDIRKAVALQNLTPSDFSDNSDSEDELENSDTLLIQLADAQAKEREKLAYEQIKVGGKLQFEIHSEGIDDPGFTGVSSIIVNGLEYCPCKKGHNVAILNEIGTVISVHVFDTTSYEEGMALSKYLEDIPENHIVLIAVQESSGDGINAATLALKMLGAVEPINPGYGASWAFAGFKGQYETKSWVSQIYRPRYEGPAMISDLINTPASDIGKISIQLHGEGFEDKSYMCLSSIKINDVERSHMGLGMNVVVLDKYGNFLTTRHFDTSDPKLTVSEGMKLKEYLDGLPNGRILCITSLKNPGNGLIEAKSALLRLGLEEPVEPGPNGSFVFLGYTGPERVSWTTQVTRTRRNGPARISQFILTPGAEAEVTYDEKESLLCGYNLFSIRIEDYGDCEANSKDLDGDQLSNKSAGSLINALSVKEKARISKVAESLAVEKDRLIAEVNKWDEQGNDIIVFAKQMCMIMIDMGNSTRGKGPLTTTFDVIKAAENIAKCGAQINKLAGEIAEMCPHSRTRSDLLVYLQQVALFSHQLTIAARVRADVQEINGDVVVTGVECAISLIEAAKNLTNAVISTLKTSYSASTKQRTDGLQVVQWRMRDTNKRITSTI